MSKSKRGSKRGISTMPPLQWFYDLAYFAWVSLRQWSNLVGGIPSLAWIVYCRSTGRDISVKEFWWFLGIFLFLAFFGAWREQYLKNKVDHLRGHIVQVGLGEGLPYGGSWITVALRLTNSGPPTIATGFVAAVKSGTFYQHLSPMSLPETTRFFHDGGIKQIKPSDLIHEKLTKAIPQGESITGYLIYIAGNISAEVLKNDWPEITIHFQDASGRKYKVMNVGGSDMPMHITGVQDPFGNAAAMPRPIV